MLLCIPFLGWGVTTSWIYDFWHMVLLSVMGQSQTALKQVAPLSILRTMCTGMNYVKFSKTFGPYACFSCPCFLSTWLSQGEDLFLIGHHYSQCLAQCLIYRIESINVVDYNELVWNYAGKRCDLLWFCPVQCIISLKAHSSLMKQVSHQAVITTGELRIWSSER